MQDAREKRARDGQTKKQSRATGGGREGKKIRGRGKKTERGKSILARKTASYGRDAAGEKRALGTLRPPVLQYFLLCKPGSTQNY